MIYVLTHEYSDGSATKVCGTTENREAAENWYNASNETNVYAIHLGDAAVYWMNGHESWRERDEKERKRKQLEQMEAQR